MGDDKVCSKLIVFVTVWDDDNGPTNVAVCPSEQEIKDRHKPSPDVNDCALQVFSSFQIVFGRNANVSFDKTKLTLPLKSHGYVAKVLLDSIPHKKIRGGFLPFVSVFLAPGGFPEEKLAIYNKIQESINDQYKTNNKVYLDTFYDEALRVTEKAAVELYGEGIEFARNRQYVKAADRLECATLLMETLGNTQKSQEFAMDMNKARVKKAQFLVQQAKMLASKAQKKDLLEMINDAQNTARKTNIKSVISEVSGVSFKALNILIKSIHNKCDRALKSQIWQEAEMYCQEAIKVAEETKIDVLVKRAQQKLHGLYFKWADWYKNFAKKLVSKKAFGQAIEYFQDGLKVLEKAQNRNKIQDIQTEIAKTYILWADQKVSESKKMLATGDLKVAHKILQDALNLAKKSKNEKVIVKIETQLTNVPDH